MAPNLIRKLQLRGSFSLVITTYYLKFGLILMQSYCMTWEDLANKSYGLLFMIFYVSFCSLTVHICLSLERHKGGSFYLWCTVPLNIHDRTQKWCNCFMDLPFHVLIWFGWLRNHKTHSRSLSLSFPSWLRPPEAQSIILHSTALQHLFISSDRWKRENEEASEWESVWVTERERPSQDVQQHLSSTSIFFLR